MDDLVTVSRNSGAGGRKAVIARARLAGTALLAAGLLSVGAAQSAFASQVGFGHLYLDGNIVGTVVVPAHVDAGSGRDPLYMVTNGVSGQLGIAGVGPGVGSYHGGEWQVWTVTFNAGRAPHLLTSADAVMGAAQAGDVTLTRMPDRDFRCPITAG